MMLECYHSSIHGSLDWLWPGFQQTGECYLFWCHFSILFIVFVPYWRSKYKICICITFTYHRNQTENIKVHFPDVSILPSVVPQAVPCTPTANIRNCFHQFLGCARMGFSSFQRMSICKLMTSEDHWRLQSCLDPGHLWEVLCMNVSWLKNNLLWSTSTYPVAHSSTNI